MIQYREKESGGPGSLTWSVRKSFKALCPTSEPGSRLDKLSGVTRTPARQRDQAAKPVEEDLEGLDLNDKA